jgi:hypothetical protein
MVDQEVPLAVMEEVVTVEAAGAPHPAAVVAEVEVEEIKRILDADAF